MKKDQEVYFFHLKCVISQKYKLINQWRLPGKEWCGYNI